MSISAPVPRKVVEAGESGGRYVDVNRNLSEPPTTVIKKKEEKPAKVRQTKPQPKQLPVETLFNFAAAPRDTRRRFNQDYEFTDQPPEKSFNNPPSNEQQQPTPESGFGRKGGRRGGRGAGGGGGGGGRGGQGRGGGRGGRRNNTPGFNRGGNTGGNLLPTQPEDWPELV